MIKGKESAKLGCTSTLSVDPTPLLPVNQIQMVGPPLAVLGWVRLSGAENKSYKDKMTLQKNDSSPRRATKRW
jgi:hypothetical protein